MTLLPLTECCLLLGVDPKTLRLWLSAAHLVCTLHPADARLKCLTPPQLAQLAALHGRPLPEATPATASQASAGSPGSAFPTANGSAPSPHPDDAGVRQQVWVLQQQVSTLQAQLTDLVLLLARCQLVPAALPALAHSSAPGSPPPPAAAPTELKAPPPHDGASPPPPARARSRALPLIQLCSDGSVVVIAPTQGVLPLLPDSPAWFAWLASIEAFSFESPHGRFSATRKFRRGKRVQSWNVHRSWHGRSCTLYLGLTPTLTLTRLHEMATAVRLRLTSL